jgi:hypothetical protein
MRISTLALFALAIGCSSPTAVTPLGDWGGKQASLTLTISGGTVAYLCGAGTIDSAWTISKDGQFSATGSHYFGGGPVPVGGTPPHPARYSGLVDGEFLTLTVLVIDLDQTLGPFQLIRGGPAVHELCV